jgi:hypothetical protein
MSTLIYVRPIDVDLALRVLASVLQAASIGKEVTPRLILRYTTMSLMTWTPRRHRRYYHQTSRSSRSATTVPSLKSDLSTK